MLNYIRELKFFKKLGVYRNLSPVLAYLLAMIFAFLLADTFEFSEQNCYVIYSICFAFLILAFQFNKKLFSLCFFFCFSLLYYGFRVENASAELPAVDATLDIRVDSINTRNERYVSGFASVLNAYSLDEELRGKEVFFVIYGEGQGVDIASRLRVGASLSPVNGELSGFDSFLARRKVSYKISSNERRVEHLEISEFAEILQRMRAYIVRNIENSSPRYEAYLPMYRALMIGDMSTLPKVDKQIFARSASIHIFAISGLHVGLVASLLFMLFRFFGLRYSVSILLSLVVLYVYVQLCGAKPSAMRAYMMLFFVAFAYLLRRRANSFNALLVSAAVALLFEPKNLYNIGFLLSYCVVASIVLYGLSLYDYLSRKYKPYSMLPDKLLDFPKRAIRGFYSYLLMSACISYSAFLGGSFLCSYFFGYVAWASVINFIVFVPLVSVILVLGFVSLLMPSFLSLWINNFVLMLLEFMTTVARFFAKPIFTIDIRINSVYILICALLVFFAILIYLRDKRDLRLIYLPIFSLVLVLCC